MSISVSNAFADALLGYDSTAHTASVADQIGSGSLVIYDGTPPGGAQDSLSSNTALATFDLEAASDQGSPSGGVMDLEFSATTVTASATGTATFFRILSSGGTSLIQGTVNTSGGDFNLSSTSITSGDNVSITGTPSIAWSVAT